MGQQGAGGYGGISTQNQDQRQGHFGPHTVSKYHDRMMDIIHLKCVNCKYEWQITKKQWFDRDVGDMPALCQPAERSEAPVVVDEASEPCEVCGRPTGGCCTVMVEADDV